MTERERAKLPRRILCKLLTLKFAAPMSRSHGVDVDQLAALPVQESYSTVSLETEATATAAKSSTILATTSLRKALTSERTTAWERSVMDEGASTGDGHRVSSLPFPFAPTADETSLRLPVVRYIGARTRYPQDIFECRLPFLRCFCPLAPNRAKRALLV